jgi:hypothetical protein
MHRNKSVLFIVLLLSAIYGKVLAHEIVSSDVDYSTLNWVDDKAYFTADQFIMTDKGIFVILQVSNGMLAKVLVTQVNFDATGLFVLAEHFPSPQMAFCRLGHPACQSCGRCNTPGCPTPPCRCRKK